MLPGQSSVCACSAPEPQGDAPCGGLHLRQAELPWCKPLLQVVLCH